MVPWLQALIISVIASILLFLVIWRYHFNAIRGSKGKVKGALKVGIAIMWLVLILQYFLFIIKDSGVVFIREIPMAAVFVISFLFILQRIDSFGRKKKVQF